MTDEQDECQRDDQCRGPLEILPDDLVERVQRLSADGTPGEYTGCVGDAVENVAGQEDDLQDHGVGRQRFRTQA